ncbi:UDP-N-acetylmuramoyl-L-alanyl-D-glutamate--2,6-diaminopimelate ligase [Arcanobacterium bovis]|uniref:UDP-N-acetylmuramyl-tripeptide synthetase n=1 Tax=Arcanobacterium bovis TaxID=2529275 RepID=A0A4Q9V2H2_9ACTO|nr:UDP-N-acetylmuramoyl-L-alanyl-D-glutamate--2,6-diaminopimelate ligase [Arcanobacterium bovis]TBW22758.1 UDP-N-acetylmuramoyl-L-alanyl-D-glutamate--2,6-diaminopimelate ligase [Arcanobacterium bovis]
MIRPTVNPQHTLTSVVDFLLTHDALAALIVGNRSCDLRKWRDEHDDLAAQFERIGVTGAAIGSREIEAGDIFIAVPGERVHGAKFASAAQSAGAVAILTDRAGYEIISSDQPLEVPVLIANDIAGCQGAVATFVYNTPCDGVSSFGITGTNGKTTTSYILDFLLSALGRTVGLVGTVVVRVGNEEIPAMMTTPQAVELQAMLANMREHGMDTLVMEVSSHALAQKRTKPICFDVAGFTNLTQDHLDFHKTFDEYYAAKKELFSPDNSRFCVISVDDDFGRRLYEETVQARPDSCLALAVKSELGSATGWQVRNIATNLAGSTFDLHSPAGERISVNLGLPGEFNVQNAALAIAMLVQAGVGIQEISQVLAMHGGLFPEVPGRMELIADEPRVIVDFAHNPDALAKAIEALRPTTAGKLVVLTGSAGDRDRAKRPLMGEIVSSLADFTIITDDDPHSEDPAQIRQEIIAGIGTGADFVEIADRAEAISTAIAQAALQDTIFIAGRGHELWQDCDGVLVELDDRAIARTALAKRNVVVTDNSSETEASSEKDWAKEN